MQGEVNARQRPINSLIDENLDFQGTNSKLVIEQIGTEEYQKTLEDLIRYMNNNKIMKRKRA